MQYTLICFVFWTYALIWCAHSSLCDVTDSMDETQDACYGLFEVKLFQNQSSREVPEKKHCLSIDVTNEYYWIKNESCLIYPGNILYCSFSTNCVQECDLSTSVISCGNGERNSTVACLAVPGVAEDKIECQGEVEENVSFVALHGTLSFPQTQYNFLYEYKYDYLEVLRPPPDISVSVRGGDLLVTWSMPFSRSSTEMNCFTYELNINNRIRDIKGKLNYTELNIDRSLSYSVTLRTQKTSSCTSSLHWSEWSDIVGLEPVAREFNYLVIGCISLGIPMVLLASLLLLRPQRVIKLIFPPIPHPPLKIRHLLDKSGSIEFPSAVQTHMEDITNVDHIEETPETATLA